MKKFSEIHLLSSIAIVFFPFPFFPIPSLRDRVMMQSSIYNSLQMCFVILFTRIYLVGLFENFMEVSRIIYSECFLVMKQRSLVQTFLFPSPWGQNSLILKRKKKKKRNICWSCSRTRKHRHFIWGCHTRVRHRTHLWHLCMRVLARFFFFFFCWKNCRTLEGHLSILNNYLVIFYLLFWILFLVCILISKHHIYIYIYFFFFW